MTYAISLSGTTVSIASPGPRGIGVPTGGTTGQVLKKASDTNYDFTWGADTAGIANVVEDTTPQLGGSLDVNGNAIVSVSNGNIAITPNGTGSVVLDGLSWPQSDGTINQVLKTNGSGTLTFGDASVVATTLDLTDTPGSYGTAGEVLALNSGASAFEFVANVASSSYTLDTLGTVAEGSITDVVALTATQYADIGTPDPNTLFVITDGTTSIADSDDVTITGAATNDFLIYTGSVWEDQTPAQARTALGISAFGTTLIDDADAATARATLGANDASNLTTGTLADARLDLRVDSGATFDGQGSEVATATSVLVPIERAGVITAASLIANASGSITITVKRYTPSAGSLGAATTLGTIALSSTQHNRDTTLSGWTTTISAGDVLEFVTGGTIATVERVTVKVKIEES